MSLTEKFYDDLQKENAKLRLTIIQQDQRINELTKENTLAHQLIIQLEKNLASAQAENIIKKLTLS